MTDPRGNDHSKDFIPDWLRVYELLDTPLSPGSDCGDYCRDRAASADADVMRSSLGYVKPFCCHSRPDSSFIHDVTLLPTEAEWRYAVGYDEEEQNNHNYPCAVLEDCPRSKRPFLCRTFPWFPLPDAHGRILRMVKWEVGVESNCPADRVHQDWLRNWWKVWPHLLKHKGVRIEVFEYIIDSVLYHDKLRELTEEDANHTTFIVRKFTEKVESLDESYPNVSLLT